jgi:hypothetical protein
MNRKIIDDPSLQLQHYEESQAAATGKQQNWVPAFTGITDYLEPRQFSFTPTTKVRRH